MSSSYEEGRTCCRNSVLACPTGEKNISKGAEAEEAERPFVKNGGCFETRKIGCMETTEVDSAPSVTGPTYFE